ncbi:hypothetical protein P7B03_05940 [Lysobacter soli]|nr:hypothetical protein [Lysobacter soli]
MSGSDQACVAFARIGLVDKVNVTTVNDLVYRMLWHSRVERMSSSEAVRSLSGDATIPIGEILIGASGSFDDDEYQQISEMSEQDLRVYVNNKVSRYLNQNKTNVDVARIVGSCLDRDGLSAWPSFSYDSPGRSVLRLLYRAPPGSPREIRVSVSPDEGVSCKHDGSPVTPRKLITLKDRSEAELSCSRTRLLDRSAYVSVNSPDAVKKLTGPVWLPPAVLPKSHCKEAKTEEFMRPVLKRADGLTTDVETFGPYCSPVLISVSASAEATRNTRQGMATSTVSIHLGRDPLRDPVFTRGAENVSANHNTTIVAPLRTHELPAHQRQAFSLLMDDSSADTWAIRWQFNLKPKAPPQSVDLQPPMNPSKPAHHSRP